MKKIIYRIQSPTTQVGKSIRDAIIAGIAVGVVAILQNIDKIDFGGLDEIVATVIAFLVAQLNRTTRKIKR